MPVTSPQGTLDFKKVDKITFVGASSNTVIDTTTGSVGIGVVGDALSSNLHVVGDTRMEGNINMLHTSNTASIKLNSNVVTEFPRSKKLIKYPRVALTSAAQTNSGYESYFVSQASATLSGISDRQAWAFFDTQGPGQGTSIASPHFDVSGARYDTSGNYTGGDSLADVSGDWMYIRLPDKIQLQSVDLWARYDNIRNPIDGTVLGSLNGTNWSVIGSWKNANFTAGNATSFTINSNQYYDYIGFVFEKIEANSSGGFINFHEIDLYGTPEYDPEAHGTDVVVKSEANVPNTDWLEVYYDAKGLPNGAVGSSISGLGGTTISATKLGDPQVSNDAFVFDGSGDAIVSGATSLSGNPPLSYSVWFKTNSISSTGSNSIVAIGYAFSTKSLGLRIRGTGDTNPGNYRFYVFGGATNESVDTDIKAEIGTWTHVTVVYDGLNSKLYIDGKFAVRNTNTTTNLALDSGAKVALGNYIDSNGALYDATRSYDGSIANVRLFNRALTSDEIYQLYAYQKEYFGHGDLSMTLKAGRLGIGTSEPRAMLDVQGIPHGPDSRPCWRMLGNGVNSDDIWTWNTVQLDNFNGASGSTYYTIPVSGYYFMQVVIIVGAGGGRATLRFRQNNVTVGPDFIQDPVTTTINSSYPWNQLMGMITHYFNKGDQVTVYTSGGTYGGHNCFTGFHLGF